MRVLLGWMRRAGPKRVVIEDRCKVWAHRKGKDGTRSHSGVGEFPLQADVVVIVGGIIEVAAAFSHSRRGVQVVVLESRAQLGSLTAAASPDCFRAQ